MDLRLGLAYSLAFCEYYANHGPRLAHIARRGRAWGNESATVGDADGELAPLIKLEPRRAPQAQPARRPESLRHCAGVRSAQTATAAASVCDL